MDWLAAIPILGLLIAVFFLGNKSGKLKSTEKQVKELGQRIIEAEQRADRAEVEARNAETVAAAEEKKSDLAAKVVKVIAEKLPDTVQAEGNLQRLEGDLKEAQTEQELLEIAARQAEQAVTYIGEHQ